MKASAFNGGFFDNLMYRANSKSTIFVDFLKICFIIKENVDISKIRGV